MTDLAGWFAAQLDADEQTARAAQEAADGLAGSGELWVATGADYAVGVDYDPAFVLADITAKRRILAEHATQDVPVLEFRGELIMSGPECRVCADWDAADMDGPPNAPAPCQTLRLLAAPYASRPGYDPTWAPDQPAHNTTGDAT